MKRFVLPLVGFLVLLFAPGCVGPFKATPIEAGNDPVVVHAERAQRISLDTFRRVTQWEFQERFSLPADVSRAVDAYRREFPPAWKESRIALDTYKQSAGTNATTIQSITSALLAANASLSKLMADANPGQVGEAIAALNALINSINVIFTPSSGSTNSLPSVPRTNAISRGLRTVSP